ncbi:retrovirus-related pol polyprotein from transposon TNT 1-94 [Tanacetum coccineum]
MASGDSFFKSKKGASAASSVKAQEQIRRRIGPLPAKMEIGLPLSAIAVANHWQTITFRDQWPLTRNTPNLMSFPTKQWKAHWLNLLIRKTCLLVCTDRSLVFGTQAAQDIMTRERSRAQGWGISLKKFIRTVRFGNGPFCCNYGAMGILSLVDCVISRHSCLKLLVNAGYLQNAPLFLWAEAVATACYTQNRSLIHTLHNKTPYELVHDKKPDLSFLRIFGALCYPTNDIKDLSKLKAKADIRFFVGYAPNRKGYRIYNKRTRQIMETIHVTFDELTEQTTPVHSSSGPAPNLLTPGLISSGLVPNSAHAIPYVPPTNKDLELLFQPMFDEYFETPTGDHQMPLVPTAPTSVIPTGPSVPISFDHDAPSDSHSPSSSAHQSSLVHHGVATEHSFEVNPFTAT